MLRLKLLGTIALERDGISLPWLSRGWQRGALFALVAAAGKRGIDRDMLASLLWTDSDEAAARHSLDELLSRSRRETDCKSLFAPGGAVAFSAGDISVDLDEFNGAMRNQQYERAVDLYGGAFADGLRVVGSNEVERRIDLARAQCAADFVSALLHLAQRKTQQNDHRSAAKYWQRAVEGDPLSVSTNKGYLTALLAAGEHARAALHVRIFRQLLEQEFGIEPDDEIKALEHRIRSGPQATPAAAPSQIPVGGNNRIVSGDELHRFAIQRILGTEYTQGSLIEETSLANVFRVQSRANNAELELHVVRTPVASPARQSQFDSAFSKTATLSHSNIVPVFSHGISDSIAYWIAGSRPNETLRSWLKRGRAVALPESLAMLRSLAFALRYAHEHGVYHGDLRPKRIGLNSGQAFVTGFGLVSAFGGNTEEPSASQSTVLGLGSPQYQSPEQMYERAGADLPADIYAFGCIAYELLTGDPPFGEAGLAMARRKLTGQVTPLHELRPTISATISAAVMTCLAYAPGDRGDAVPILE